MTQEYAEKASSKQREEEFTEEDVETVSQEFKEDVEKARATIDDILDEIDDVLEANAEQFVESYRQQGGE